MEHLDLTSLNCETRIEKLNFISSEIKRLENSLKNAAFPSKTVFFRDIVTENSIDGVLKWDANIKRLIYRNNNFDFRPLIECSAVVREEVFPNLPKFIEFFA